jgi:hypothetical protein
MSERANNWTDEHPEAPGVYWISVHPGQRNPRPWLTLPNVFLLSIDPDGDVRQGLPGDDGAFVFRADVLYTADNLPESVKAIQARYMPLGWVAPADPWVTP